MFQTNFTLIFHLILITYSFICHLNQMYFIVCVLNSLILIVAFMNCKYLPNLPKKPTMIFSPIIDQYLIEYDLLQNTILE